MTSIMELQASLLCVLVAVSLCTVQAGSYTNLALKKKVWQSSTAHDGYPGRATDGNRDGHWNHGSCTHTNKDDYPWLRIDLGAPNQDITSVDVYNRRDCCGDRLSGLTVRVSNNYYNNANDIRRAAYCGVLSQTASFYFHHIVCSSKVSGRYLYLYIPRTEYLTICEVEVFGSPQTNLALRHSVSHSSTYAHGKAKLAVDGNHNAHYEGGYSCSHTKKDYYPWMRIDLGKKYDVTSVDVYNRQDGSDGRLKDLTVRVSDYYYSNKDDIRRAAMCGILNGSPQPRNNIFCHSGASGRYVYLYIPRSEFLQICEVEVFGTRK